VSEYAADVHHQNSLIPRNINFLIAQQQQKGSGQSHLTAAGRYQQWREDQIFEQAVSNCILLLQFFYFVC
jgi:hypothetical protein